MAKSTNPIAKNLRSRTIASSGTIKEVYNRKKEMLYTLKAAAINKGLQWLNQKVLVDGYEMIGKIQNVKSLCVPKKSKGGEMEYNG